MVTLEVDAREVRNQKDGSVTFHHNQVQRYTKEAAVNLVKDFKKELKSKEEWIADFENNVDRAKKEAESQLFAMRTQIEKDLKFLKEGIELWENPTTPTEK